MKLEKIAVAAMAALALSSGAASQAQTPFGACLSIDMAKFDGTVVDAALATPELSTLVDAVVSAGLVDALSEAEDITVYAPTNDAFAALPSGILDTVVSDLDLLTTVLTYHVSPNRQDPRKWIEPRAARTLAGSKVFFHRQDQKPRVNGAAVDCQGVRTDNGTVWLIDSVLIP